MINWARDNQELSGLGDLPCAGSGEALNLSGASKKRDAYDGLILDPPKFGRGPKGEVWEFYKLLPELLQACQQVLSDQPCFIILTAYAVKASALTLYYAIDEVMHGKNGQTEAGEVVLEEKSAGRLLSMAIFARWSSQPVIPAG